MSAIAKFGTSAAFMTTTMARPSRANQLPDSSPLTSVCSMSGYSGAMNGCSSVHLPPV